jgi:hypothetical protein
MKKILYIASLLMAHAAWAMELDSPQVTGVEISELVDDVKDSPASGRSQPCHNLNSKTALNNRTNAARDKATSAKIALNLLAQKNHELLKKNVYATIALLELTTKKKNLEKNYETSLQLHTMLQALYHNQQKNLQNHSTALFRLQLFTFGSLVISLGALYVTLKYPTQVNEAITTGIHTLWNPLVNKASGIISFFGKSKSYLHPILRMISFAQ